MGERRLWRSPNKEHVIAAFLKEFGEHASWEQWLTFLHERSKLEEFEWVQSCGSEFTILEEIVEGKKDSSNQPKKAPTKK